MVGVYYKDDWKNRCYVEIKNVVVLINQFVYKTKNGNIL